MDEANLGEAERYLRCQVLIRRFAKTLDREYLEPRLRQVSEAFARADILEIYNREVERNR